jgi:hypothetical protein
MQAMLSPVRKLYAVLSIRAEGGEMRRASA